MKYILLFFIVIITSCEEIIEVELSEPESQIVIDAEILTEIDTSFEGGFIFARIQFANSFFEDMINYVNDAEVFLKNLTTGEVINLDAPTEVGFYRPSQSPTKIDKNAIYELTVIHNGQTFKAKNIWYPTAAIDTVLNLGTSSIDEFERTELKVYFKDNPDETNFYLFDLTPYQRIQLFDDRFFDSSEKFNFSIFPINGQLKENEGRITIINKGIGKSYFNYLTKLLELSQPDVLGPFATPRPQSNGNFINITNPENPPFGYFNISEQHRYSYEVR